MENSEETLERRLTELVRELKGRTIKLPAIWYEGIPDRLVLLPPRRTIFLELKKEGEKPTKIQVYWQNWLRLRGFEAYVLDSYPAVEALLRDDS